MSKIVCVLYDDPVTGYPKKYARDDLPRIDALSGRPDHAVAAGDRLQAGAAARQRFGRAWPAQVPRVARPQAGRDLGQGRAEQPLREGDRRRRDRDLAAVLARLPTAERIAKAPKLKLVVTAGIGSDHTDLQAAMNRGITVAEVTYCNSISVSEHVVMMILSLVRNYIPSHEWVSRAAGTSPTASSVRTTWKA